MLKFVKHHMETIAGIDIFPLISLVIFFVFFVGLFIYIIRADQKEINQISRIPLDAKADNHDLS